MYIFICIIFIFVYGVPSALGRRYLKLVFISILRFVCNARNIVACSVDFSIAVFYNMPIVSVFFLFCFFFKYLHESLINRMFRTSLPSLSAFCQGCAQNSRRITQNSFFSLALFIFLYLSLALSLYNIYRHNYNFSSQLTHAITLTGDPEMDIFVRLHGSHSARPMERERRFISLAILFLITCVSGFVRRFLTPSTTAKLTN